MKLFYDSPSAKLYEGVAQKLDLIPDDSVNLICTSPPFNIGAPASEAWSVPDWYKDDMPESEYQEAQIKALAEMFRVARPGASLMYEHKVRLKDGTGIHPMQWLLKTEWSFIQQITWDRGSTHNHIPTRFWPQDELIFWLAKGKPDNVNGQYMKFSSVWKIQFETNSWHPAPFPIQLPERCILACSKEGDIVLDPFSGSGTTVRAAQNLKRIGIGVDKEIKYLEKSKLRLMQRSM